MILPTNQEGVELKQMKMSGGPGSGTTLVLLENARIPKENVIGQVGHGLKYW